VPSRQLAVLKAEQRQMNDITAKGKTQEDFAYGQKG
jgi:DNA-binding CsgD family transcriptional regulator